MFLYKDFENYFPFTLKIIDCYSELALMSITDENDINMFFLKLQEITELNFKDFECYSKISYDDFINYVDKLMDFSDKKLQLEDIRISYRFICIYERLKNNSINSTVLFPDLNFNIDLSITDIVNSKIIIDTYKLIMNKINSLTCDDAKLNDYVDELYKICRENAIIHIGMRELSELLAIDAVFDIDKIRDIDLRTVDKQLLLKYNGKVDSKKVVENSAYSEIIDLLERIKNSIIKYDNMDSIYTNLFNISRLEILLDYVNITQLLNIFSYYYKINITDKLMANKVKKIVKNCLTKRMQF